MEKKFFSPQETCTEVSYSYTKKAKAPLLQTTILGMLAGAFIAMGALAASIASHSIDNVGVAKFMAGAIFPVGLILVMICGANLFTGNCLLTVPLVEKKVTLKQVISNWFVTYFSNFVGALIFVALIYYSGILDFNGGKLAGYMIKVAGTKANLSFTNAFFSGILCNMLVCLAVWGSYAAKDIVGKVLMIWFPLMAFIISGFEHSVANMYYLFIGLLAKSNASYVEFSHLPAEKIANLNLSHIIQNLIPVTLGNIVGGGIFIGLAYWVAFIYTDKKVSENISIGK